MAALASASSRHARVEPELRPPARVAFARAGIVEVDDQDPLDERDRFGHLSPFGAEVRGQDARLRGRARAARRGDERERALRFATLDERCGHRDAECLGDRSGRGGGAHGVDGPRLVGRCAERAKEGDGLVREGAVPGAYAEEPGERGGRGGRGDIPPFRVGPTPGRLLGCGGRRRLGPLGKAVPERHGP